MKRLFLLLGAALLAACVLCACAAPAVATDTPVTAVTTASLTVSYAPDAYADGAQPCVYFEDTTAPNTEWKLLFSADGTLYNCKVLSLNEAEMLTVEAVLFEAGSITPDRPLLVATYINDATLNRGICFDDAAGNTRYFAVSVSMDDGVLSLVEFTK